MATINHKTYNEGTETFKDFSVYDGKDTLIFKVDGSAAAVGIGTANPIATLTAEATNANVAVINVIGTSPNYIFDVRDDGSSIFRVTSEGNVKLGSSTTGSPSANADDLVIDKGAAESGITIMSTAAATLRFGDAANTSVGSIEYDHSGDYMRFNTSGSEKVRITSAGNVGIGTSAPDQKLNIVGSEATAYATSSVSEVVPLGGVNMTMQNTATGGFTSMRFVSLDGSNAIGYMGFTNTTASIGGAFVFGQRSGGGYAEQVRIQSGGGISFNGDTAAANALDDYEEGTFTPTLNFGGASVGVTYGTVAGKYTKIGNLVNFSIRMTLTSKGSSTGEVRIAGLPFTIVNTGNADFTSLSIGALQNITFVDFPMGLCIAGTDYLLLEESASGGSISQITNADFQNDSVVRVGGFYYTA